MNVLGRLGLPMAFTASSLREGRWWEKRREYRERDYRGRRIADEEMNTMGTVKIDIWQL